MKQTTLKCIVMTRAHRRDISIENFPRQIYTTNHHFPQIFVVRTTPGNKLSHSDTQDPETCAGVNAMVAHPGLAQKFARRGKRGGEKEEMVCPHDNHGET